MSEKRVPVRAIVLVALAWSIAGCVQTNAKVNEAAKVLREKVARLNRLTVPNPKLTPEEQVKVEGVKEAVEQVIADIVSITTPKGE